MNLNELPGALISKLHYEIQGLTTESLLRLNLGFAQI